MDAVTFCFYLGIPLFFGLLQFFVTRSKKLSPGKKYIPLAVVGGISALTWGACFGYVPLPETYLIDGQGGFISFPDYFAVGLFCIPAMAGLAFGALFGVAGLSGRDDHER